MGTDNMDGGPKRPRDLGESAGFRRRGLPNAFRDADSQEDDPRAFEKVATGIQSRMEQLLQEKPELGVAQSDVDGKKAYYLEKGKVSGLKTLEDAIEEAMRTEVRGTDKLRDAVIDHLSLALAYLQLTKETNEDFLDVHHEQG
jgi:hypothetical protein